MKINIKYNRKTISWAADFCALSAVDCSHGCNALSSSIQF